MSAPTTRRPGAPEDRDLVGELTDALERHARHDRVALLDDEGPVTYRDLARRVERAAAGLSALGLPPGSTVGIAAEKGVPQVVALLAAVRAGHCGCVLDPRLSASQAADPAAEFGISLLLADPARLREPRTAPDGPAPTAPEAGPAVTPLEAVLDGTEDPLDPLALPPCEPSAPALLLFTSGSTGAPKGIRLTRGNLLAHARGVVAHTGLTPDDRLLHLMPLHHTNGVNNQILAPLLAGASIALVARFRAAAVEDQIDHFQPTILTGVPTMYLRMLPHLRPGSAHSPLRLLRCGSAPLTAAQHDQIETAFGVPLIQSYGLSEATCTTAMNPPHAPRRGTVGTVLAGQQVRILDPSTGRDVPPGAEGEICIGGPTVMRGYEGDTGGDGPVRDGLLHTGDLGSLDADGYLSVTGRLKDVVIRGGENLSPYAIETALTVHPQVREAAVVGAPHHDLGEVPMAFVVPADPRLPPDAEALRTHVAGALSRIHAPARIEVVEALPVNGVGKVDKKTLRAQARHHGAGAPPAVRESG
ncbi:class I adenylate-forming enzyme family protein [Streptomyces odontomachi]|uniref:class I adenylate-forming enzyme family protein n=1 Tax=Streptomyces odontomachi TaxID=2944940 RepID=UPI00210A448A|nr:class I adenylate-forming enzyme family protein [Streptomyces sp. ODS25]